MGGRFIMYCSECGETMQWRCTNTETGIAKYKCPECGNVQTGEDEYKAPVKNPTRLPKYYYLKDGKYIVRRWIDGEHKYIGSYADEETARKVVDKMVECDWDKARIPQVYAELNIEKVNRSWVCV